MKINSSDNHKSKNFAVIGAMGYIAPRHFQAIDETGNRVLAVMDPKLLVGVKDSELLRSVPNRFTSINQIERFLNGNEYKSDIDKVDYISICSPSYLHYEHCRLALTHGTDVICEKPIVLKPRELDHLIKLQQKTKKKIYTVLQLRHHPSILKLKEFIDANSSTSIHEVELTFIAGRDLAYLQSWKGQDDKSGGIAVNIGIHLFDLLIWLFGDVKSSKIYLSEHKKISGYIQLDRARVRWFLSIDISDLPDNDYNNQSITFRSMTVDGFKVEFSKGYAELHTLIYKDILNNNGLEIEDARPSIEFIDIIKNSKISKLDTMAHHLISSKKVIER